MITLCVIHVLHGVPAVLESGLFICIICKYMYAYIILSGSLLDL